MAEMEWFRDARYGMFIHWDHSSVQGVEIGWPLVDRSIIDRGDGSAEDKVSIEQYQETAATFNPQSWDAHSLASLALDNGVKYAVFTTRHHAGFSILQYRISPSSTPSLGGILSRSMWTLSGQRGFESASTTRFQTGTILNTPGFKKATNRIHASAENHTTGPDSVVPPRKPGVATSITFEPSSQSS
jgi:hypothetical protein